MRVSRDLVSRSQVSRASLARSSGSWTGRALRRVEVVGVTCLLLAPVPVGPCPARSSHAVRSRPSRRCRSPPQLQHFGPGTRGCLPRKELRGRHIIPGDRGFLTGRGSLWTAGPPDLLHRNLGEAQSQSRFSAESAPRVGAEAEARGPEADCILCNFALLRHN